ncbi:MAG: hypothetical protein A2Z34_05385 [Planctomycetes bacterium RBG_16_59_8]|nr:MAG: hypothetical protein A2Z34_05385 [Planctomycetes bacterium RBG_16_59_8]
MIDLSEDELTADRYFDLGSVQLAQGKWQEAINYFDKTIALAPKHFTAFVKRGTAKQELGIKTLGKPLTIGVDLSSSPLVKGAYEDFSKAVKLNPKCADAYKRRGLLQALSGNWALAISDYDLAIKANPKFSDAYDSRALVKKQNGDLTGALADANKAIQNIDSAGAKSRWAFYRTRGDIKEKLGDIKGAVADWKEAVRLFPDIGRELNPKIKSAQSGR